MSPDRKPECPGISSSQAHSSTLSVVSYWESVASYILLSFIVVFRRKVSPALLLQLEAEICS